MSDIAKVFMTGCSQAIRLPKKYRFKNQKEVFIRLNADTQEVILSAKDNSWSGFLEVLEQTSIPENFMAERIQIDSPREKLID